MVNLKTFASSGKADTTGFVPYTGGTADIVIAHDIKIDSDSKKLILGDGQDADIYYDGTDLIITSDTVGSGITKFSNDIDVTGNIVVSGNVDGRNIASDLVPYTGGASAITIAQDINIDSDSKRVIFGDGQNASIYYDGSNLYILADDVGTGIVKLSTDMALRDSKKVLLGTGNDSSIEDDGTNMKINTDEQSAGTGTDTRNLEITGAVINPIQQWAFGGTKSAAGGNVFRCALSGGRSETITEIEDGTEGQIITLIGNGVATTLSEGAIVGDNLIVPGSSIVVGDTDTAQLVFDGTIGLSGKWVVISYSNNSV